MVSISPIFGVRKAVSWGCGGGGGCLCGPCKELTQNTDLKVVTSERIGGSGVMSTLGTWCGGVVMGVLLPFNEAAILYRHFNCAPLQKQKIIVFAANNSRCCE
jgi:hypothetical protein